MNSISMFDRGNFTGIVQATQAAGASGAGVGHLERKCI